MSLWLEFDLFSKNCKNMTFPSLTAGFIASVFDGTYETNPNFKAPVVQVNSVKKTASTQPNQSAAGATDRYRLVVSDGEHWSVGKDSSL